MIDFPQIINRSFTTWADFGAVWKWAKQQEWWDRSFMYWLANKDYEEISDLYHNKVAEVYEIALSCIDPLHFPPLIVDFLREKEAP